MYNNLEMGQELESGGVQKGLILCYITFEQIKQECISNKVSL